VIRQAMFVGIVIAFASPAWAQGANAQQSDVAKPPVVAARELHYPIRMMEGNLDVAIERAVDNILAQIRDVAPDLPVLRGTSKARGTMLEGYGIVFYLEIPTIQPGVIEAYKQMMTPAPSIRPVSADPMPSLPSSTTALIEKVARSPVFQDSRAVYHRAVRDSLTDALLDSVVLSLGAQDVLTLWVTSDDPASSSAMILTVKTADLDLFRAKQITREEMRSRILVQEF
jgi:hypothetical protein